MSFREEGVLDDEDEVRHEKWATPLVVHEWIAGCSPSATP